MELPTGIGDLRSFKARAKSAFATESQWESLLTDAYDYYLPNRNLFNRESEGQPKMDLIFDSTAPMAIQIGASKLQENIAPIWSRWAIHEISEELKRDIAAANDSNINEEELRRQLEVQTEIAFDYINRSNFGSQFYEMALDLLIGTGTLNIREEEDSEKMFSFHSVPQKHIGFEEGPSGVIETHWRMHTIIGRNLERTWKNLELSEPVKERILKDPECKVKCTEGVVFRPDDATYHGVLWIEDEDRISWHQNYKEIGPFVTGRYSKTSGEVRGRGPALMVLPDVKSLNKAKEFTLTKAAIDLAGMWTATDDGVTNPYNIVIAPGIVLPVGSNNTSNPSIARLDTSSSLQLALFEIEELKTSIKAALFNDLRDPTGPVRSATEVAMEGRDLAKRVGSAYGRLQTEVLVPTLKRVMGILVKRGKMNPVVIDGKKVDIKFTSPLARSQDMEDILAVQQSVEFVLQTAGPDQAKIGFKLEDFGTWVAKKSGMPAELVRSKAEKDAVIKAGAEAAKAQMEQGRAPQDQAQPPLRDGQDMNQ
jgi:hypothetical protein